MSTLSYTMSDSMTMLRRKLKHAQRYPGIMLGTVIVPAGMLLLFVFAFGDTLGRGLAGSAGTSNYVNYLSPGLFIMAVSFAAMATALGVAIDMTKGIVNRFRTMPIAHSSVLTGHVIGAVIQTLASVVVVVVVALIAGFRPTANAGQWAAAVGMITLFSYALTWLSVAFGLLAKSPASASNTPMIFQVFSFLSSTFVPAQSMAPGLRIFAEYQPFTAVNETVRGLLIGTPIGDKWIIALAWCVVIALGGYLWSRKLFRRDPSS
jgi:ABC-2 type transport system permease protein